MPDPQRASTPRPHEDVLDRAYLKYADSDPFVPIVNFIDHATMGPEALVALGLGDRVDAWISRHHVRPYRAPLRGILMATDWRRALGRREYHRDWIRHLDAELARRPYTVVLAEWVPRFAHKVGAHLFHGVIRTAHATRALAHRDTPARRGELARGLALWAVGVDAPPPLVTGAAAIEATRADFLTFARHGAATLLDSPNVPAVHYVTGPMAYLLLAPYLDEQTHAVALASFADTHERATARYPALQPKISEIPNPPPDHDFTAGLADQRDAHPIKLTEAALRAHAETDDGIFRKAAAVALRLHSIRGLLGVARAMLRRRAA